MQRALAQQPLRRVDDRGLSSALRGNRHAGQATVLTMRRCLFESEHVDYRESVRRFVAEEVTPHQAQWEADGIVDRELFAKAATKGMLAMEVPEEYGGSWGRRLPLQRRSSARRSWRAGVGRQRARVTLHNDICLPYFLNLCNEEQKQRWLPGIADGDAHHRASP